MPDGMLFWADENCVRVLTQCTAHLHTHVTHPHVLQLVPNHKLFGARARTSKTYKAIIYATLSKRDTPDSFLPLSRGSPLPVLPNVSLLGSTENTS